MKLVVLDANSLQVTSFYPLCARISAASLVTVNFCHSIQQIISYIKELGLDQITFKGKEIKYRYVIEQTSRSNALALFSFAVPSCHVGKHIFHVLSFYSDV